MGLPDTSRKVSEKNPAAVALGKLGGASKSAKKQAASRANGRKPKPGPNEAVATQQK